MFRYNIFLDNGDYVGTYRASVPCNAMRKASVEYFKKHKNESTINFLVQMLDLLKYRKERFYTATKTDLPMPIQKTINNKTFFIRHLIKIVNIKL